MIGSTRIWIMAAAAAMIAVLAGGWFVGVQPQLAAADTSAQSTAGVEAQNQITRMKLAALAKAAAKTESMQAENEDLLLAVPTILKPNRFIKRVEDVAALNGVDVLSVSPGNAVAYTPPATPARAPGAAAPAGTVGLGLARTSPAITPANLTVVPVSIMVKGGADALMQYVHDLQNDQRAFDITSITTAKDDDSSAVTGTLSGYIYVLKR